MLVTPIYVGFFLDARSAIALQSINGDRLERLIENQHITTEYRPPRINEKLLGQEISFKAVGYGNDGDNEGILVGDVIASEESMDELKKAAVPHVTISCSQCGKPVNTAKLNFVEYRCSPTFSARYGFYGDDGRVHFDI